MSFRRLAVAMSALASMVSWPVMHEQHGFRRIARHGKMNEFAAVRAESQ